MNQQLSKTQQAVIDRLSTGWSITSFSHDGMTEWKTYRGRSTGYACSIATLKSMERKGLVKWTGSQWVLVNNQ